ncbi:hypothetical protein B0T21DRAFT_357539 [Apiosordaria backusii]|uniref:Uncharacterized protein n=1 Tax=Apiosordaria backusii TaxID=314023 RepID=A0AA40K384_9PEZI|nr:hypothetical protein B0T21DRAFT_357539 [Apiosordaria backusii]
MVTLMTGMYPELPPKATKMRFTPSLSGVDVYGNPQPLVETWCYGEYVMDLPSHIDPRLYELLEYSKAMLETYKSLGRTDGNHDETDWPRDWFMDAYENQTPWTDKQLEAWVNEAIYEPPEPRPPSPDPGSAADSQEPVDTAKEKEKENEVKEKRKDAAQRQKQWKRWLARRSRAEREAIERLPQDEYKDAYRKWLSDRWRDEDQEKRLRAYIEYRKWKQQRDQLMGARPAPDPPGPYYAWFERMSEEEVNRPYSEEYIRECAREISQYRANQYRDLRR